MLTPIEMMSRYSVREGRKIQKVCDPVFSAFNANYVFCNRISNDGKLAFLGNQIDWISHFFSDPLGKEFPFFSNPKYMESGVYDLAFSRSSALNWACRTAAEKFKIYPCLMFVKKLKNESIQFGVGVASDFEESRALILSEKEILSQFFDYFETELEELIQDAKENPVNLREYSPTTFLNKPKVDKIDFGTAERIEILKSLGLFDSSLKQVHLSFREKQCADFLLSGFTAKEVGLSLGLSSRTVEAYFECLKNKLGCSQKSLLKDKLRKMQLAGLLD